MTPVKGYCSDPRTDAEQEHTQHPKDQAVNIGKTQILRTQLAMLVIFQRGTSSSKFKTPVIQQHQV